ncbi:TRAP transporter large permease subunit, partial [Klebsiella pneumoniae]|nr:TRAP transporter large permease subunit [Klebsiella pneumoniae]
LLGVTANLSITRLFIAGIFPGLLLGVALTIAWWWLCRSDRHQTLPKATWPERWAAIKAAGWRPARSRSARGGASRW